MSTEAVPPLPVPSAVPLAASPASTASPEHTSGAPNEWAAPPADATRPAHRLRIYSHSSLFYWWPVWAVGYVMALLTYFYGQSEQVGAGQPQMWIHPSSNLGVLYFLTLFLVIVITNFSVRGLASALGITGACLIAVVLAYIGWWDNVFFWFGNLKIHLTMGAYFWFSTLMLLAWAITTFGLDRLSYLEVTPGQVTHNALFGSGSQNYNAQGMGLEKHRDDLFRHWLLGLGSGDLQIRTTGATHEQIDVVNVLFVGSKVAAMQRLISEASEDPVPHGATAA